MGEMSEAFRVEPEVLLNESRWVRELARNLTIDRASADDLAQETWLASLRHAPKQLVSTRAWLGRVLFNAARQEGRRNVLRVVREQGAARPEALPSTAELAERAELQRTLVAAVLALSEPYRSTILWRYFGDLSSEEIARRLDVSPSTVRNRLRRGLDLLRTALQRQDASNWEDRCVALAAFGSGARVGGVEIASSWMKGAVVMGTKLKIAIAFVALIAASALLWRGLNRPQSASAQLTSVTASATHVAPAINDVDDKATARTHAPVVQETSSAITAPGELIDSKQPEPTLAFLKDRLRAEIEGTLSGQVNPTFYLDLATRLTALEPGTVLLEPDPSGAVRFPLEGTPEGMHAELLLRKTNNPRFDSRVCTLLITLDNSAEPYVVDGVKRRPAQAQVTLWRGQDGSVRNFGILTNLAVNQRPELGDRISESTLFNYDVDNPYAAAGHVSGMVFSPGAVPGTLTGGLQNYSEIPITVIGGKWPNTEGLDKFNVGMQTLYGKLPH
jgi:RNA polymerase sigma-70 factor (ECF subfamily)